MSKSGFPWRPLFILTVLSLGLLVTYDVRLHGTFKKSVTGRALRDYGVLAVWNQTSVRANVYYNQASKWLQKNAPVYYDIVNNSIGPYVRVAYEKLQQALVVAYDAFAPVRAWANKTIPPILAIINDQYVPRITAFAQQFAKSIQAALIDLGIWLQQNVFTGSLSIENLQKLTYDLVSKAQGLAGETAHWISRQISALTSK
jgi:hypothetical protein